MKSGLSRKGTKRGPGGQSWLYTPKARPFPHTKMAPHGLARLLNLLNLQERNQKRFMHNRKYNQQTLSDSLQGSCNKHPKESAKQPFFMLSPLMAFGNGWLDLVANPRMLAVARASIEEVPIAAVAWHLLGQRTSKRHCVYA